MAAWSFSFAAASLLVVSVAAHAEGQDRTSDDVEAGVQLVEEGEFEKGIVVLDAAVQRLTGPEKHARRARAYVYLGIAYFGLAQIEAARERFRAAIGEVGDLTLSADEYPPRVVDLFEQARREVNAQGARDASSLPPGLSVRVSSREAGELRGVVMAMDEKWLTLGSEGSPPLRVPVASIDRMERLVGRKRNTVRGVVVGAAAGVLIGFLMPVDPNDCSTTDDAFCSRGEAVGGSVLVGAGFGALVGALTQSDVWAPVPTDRVRTSTLPARRSGFRAALSVRF